MCEAARKENSVSGLGSLLSQLQAAHPTSTRCSLNFSFPQHFELAAQFCSVSCIINQQAANYVAVTHVLFIF